MPSHRLAPLLEPASIAVVGASPRAGSAGQTLLALNREAGYAGKLYAVNPNHAEIDGGPCYATPAELPVAPDLAILAVADARLETALVQTIERGARAAVIFGGVNLGGDRDPPLAARLAAIAREADLPVCGGNGMGFYNLDRGIRASFIRPPYDTRPGGLTLISHSGSSWSALSTNDQRLGFNLTISGGQEFTVTAADYLDYALGLPSTRTVGLILETIRDPQRFVAALEKAAGCATPLVALKAGRTPQSARMALSHSGAIAGDDAAYEALFERYGVTRVATLDDMAATMALLSHPAGIGEGALVSTHDSGFERELLIDLATDAGTALAGIGAPTRARLGELLDPGLEPVNPLDAWGTGRDYEVVFTETFCALLADPAAAVGFVCHSPRDGHPLSQAWARAAAAAAQRVHKPVAMVANHSWTRHPAITQELREAGVLMIEGTACGLRAAASAFAYRDFTKRPTLIPPAGPPAATRARWRRRLAQPAPFDEAEALALLGDYGVSVPATQRADSRKAAVAAAHTVGLPVALKTAAGGIHHKSDQAGVYLGLGDAGAVAAAYDSIAARLGPQVLVAAMAPAGVEMSLGVVRDAQFGSLITIGAGGTLIELLQDRRMAMPPFDAAYALRLIKRLTAWPLLGGWRGRAGVDVDAFADAAARLSVLAGELGGHIAEMDVNPLIVSPAGAVAVDALLITSSKPEVCSDDGE